jgi:hypothetical protein
MRRETSIVVIVLTLLFEARADVLDKVNDTLSIRDSKHDFQLQLSGLVDLETYFIDQRPPALIDSGPGFLFNPRLSIFLDVNWTKHFYFFSQVRIDRGFDPGTNDSVEVRADEYFMRFNPRDDNVIQFQIGKFATAVGNWVPRHNSWENPFINAPLPYENVTPVADREAPSSRADFAERHNDFDENYERNPIMWGPNYTSGAAILGTVDKFDYRVEIKNAPISSRPDSWDITQIGLDHPTFSGRVDLRPSPTWTFGVSSSFGPYMRPEARVTLPRGSHIDDFDQITIAQDASFAWRHFQLWAEVFETRFEVPRVGNADTLAYYLEARYKLTPQLFAAVRWNQQFFSNVSDGASGRFGWGNDVWRTDAALGYRFTNYLQAKLQYSFTHQHAELQQGEQLVAAQLTLRF